MDERYLKLLFGDHYHGFDIDEAIENIGVYELDFRNRIEDVGGKSKLSGKIDLTSIYYFTLFCYYFLFGYKIKVVKAPEFCNFLKLYYGFYEIEHINVIGKPADHYGDKKNPKRKRNPIQGQPNKYIDKRLNDLIVKFDSKQKLNMIKTFAELLRMPNNALYIIDQYMNEIEGNDIEEKVIKDIIDKRTIARQIAIKLGKLYICLFPELYSGKSSYEDLTHEHIVEIMNILTAFNLTSFKKHPDIIKNHKHLMKDDSVFPAILYPRGKVFIYSGKKNDHFLHELSKEKILEAIANSKL